MNMLRGYYIAASGMLNQQKNLNAISNNIANSQTAGYKGDRAVQNTFNKQLILVQEMQKTSGSFSSLYTDVSYTNLTQGTLEMTESPFDVAIIGSAWFNVAGQNGNTLLTRNGQWAIDDEGYLSLGSQGRILGEGGEIQLGRSDFAISEKGVVTLNDGTYIDTLLLTQITEDAEMTKVGENMYTAPDGAANPPDAKVAVLQGAFEKSNVDVAYEMSRAMEVQRVFEACSSALRMIDQINSQSTSIGKL